MIKYELSLVIPAQLRANDDTLTKADAEGYTTITVAKYDFNPELGLQDEILIENFPAPYHLSAFKAAVTKIDKVARPNNEFVVVIVVESSDKEQMTEISDNLRKLNPGMFEG